MDKTTVIKNLPHGTGAAMGAFIRALSLTAMSRYAIIGMSVCGKGLFDKVGTNTTLVSDIVLLFTGYDYSLVESFVDTQNIVMTDTEFGDIRRITFAYPEPVGSISTSGFNGAGEFAKFYRTTNDRKIEFAIPVKDFIISFYVCNVTGNVSESTVQAALANLSTEDKIVPISAMGKRNTQIFSTLSKNTFTEDMTLHIKGENTEVSEDLDAVIMLFNDYVEKLRNSLENLKNS